MSRHHRDLVLPPTWVLCAAGAPFALAAGWLAGWALDSAPVELAGSEVVIVAQPPDPVTPMFAAAPAPPSKATPMRAAVRTVTPSSVTTTPRTATTSAAPTSAAPPVEAFATCEQARAAGRRDIPADDPRYGPHLDRDSDGVGCDSPPALDVEVGGSVEVSPSADPTQPPTSTTPTAPEIPESP